MTLKALASIIPVAVNRTHDVALLLRRFSFTDFFTITMKLYTAVGNSSSHHGDVGYIFSFKDSYRMTLLFVLRPSSVKAYYIIQVQ